VAQTRACTAPLRELVEAATGRVQVRKRSLEELPQLRFGTYNTLNLTQSADGAALKSEEKRLGVAAAILDNDLDVAVLQEVEDLQKCKDYARDYLKDRYEVLLSTGNDKRGIQVAYLVKKDLPFKIKLDSNANARAVYPVTGQEIPIFSRDLPALRIWADSQNAEAEDPLVVFYGTHFKSKRSKDGDSESRILRRTQVEAAASIIRKDRDAHPSTFMMIAGDFNGDVHKDAEFQPIKEILADAFDLQPKKLNEVDRITHTFHPRDGATQFSQIDAFFVSEDKARYIEEAFVHRYKDANGKIKPVPQTWDERELNPSDHFPVIFKMNFRKLLQERSVLRRDAAFLPLRLLPAPARSRILPLPVAA
jgi:exonuclease III